MTQKPRISTGVLLYGKTAGGNYVPVQVSANGTIKVQDSGGGGSSGGGIAVEALESYTTQTIEVSSVSTILLDTNANRRHAIVINLGEVRVFLGLGSAAQLNRGILLQPNGHYEMDWDNLYSGRLYGIADGTSSVSVIEGV